MSEEKTIFLLELNTSSTPDDDRYPLTGSDAKGSTLEGLLVRELMNLDVEKLREKSPKRADALKAIQESLFTKDERGRYTGLSKDVIFKKRGQWRRLDPTQKITDADALFEDRTEQLEKQGYKGMKGYRLKLDIIPAKAKTPVRLYDPGQHPPEENTKRGRDESRIRRWQHLERNWERYKGGAIALGVIAVLSVGGYYGIKEIMVQGEIGKARDNVVQVDQSLDSAKSRQARMSSAWRSG